ncbi:helix-turn-helix domain-containing protein [Nonomuraea maheshkhaliensis]
MAAEPWIAPSHVGSSVGMASTGDFGRRIIHKRERLGLTREEVAERANMSAGFVNYLEENPDVPDTGTLIGLASALETTVEDLLGGVRNRPPDRDPTITGPVLEVLEPDECLSLVAPGGIGRIAFDSSYGPTVLPVNYKLHQGSIIFRTAYGGPMDQDLRAGVKGVEIKIGFEVDRIDQVRHEGWSVLIQGPAHHLTFDEVPEIMLTPWAGGDRELYIRIVPDQISGRRVHGL